MRTLPIPDLFVNMYVHEEAVLSSQIEGTQSSLQNLLAAEASLHDPDAPPDVGEVVSYVRATNYGLARVNELPVSVRLLREIHAELMRGVRGAKLTPGELRTSQNWIGPGNRAPLNPLTNPTNTSTRVSYGTTKNLAQLAPLVGPPLWCWMKSIRMIELRTTM